MNQVFARIRMRGNGNRYRKLLSTDKAIYQLPEELIHASYKYRPGSVLDSGEWFKITDFSNEEFALDLTRIDYESIDYDSLRKNEYSKIDYLFVRIGQNIYFQNVSKAKLVRRKCIWEFGEGYRYVDEASVLPVNEYPDAIYIPRQDTLYFRRIESITSIFRGISVLYRMATENEVSEFLHNNFIALNGEFNSNKVGVLNRKKIALVKDTLAKMQDDDRKQIFTYICDYCPDIVIQDGKFLVKSDNDLKLVLFGIEQKFYTTVVGREKRIANSVLLLPVQEK